MLFFLFGWFFFWACLLIILFLYIKMRDSVLDTTDFSVAYVKPMYVTDWSISSCIINEFLSIIFGMRGGFDMRLFWVR